MSKENAQFLKELNVNLSKEVPHRWRVQSFSKNKPSATVVAYIDSRDASDLLNEYAIYGWSDEYYEVGKNTYCKVGIVMPDGTMQWRSDCGVESNQDAEKGQASDAFKRACVKWGIGRFLYKLGIEYVNANETKGPSNWPFPVDEQGKRIWDLTEYINNKKKGSKVAGSSSGLTLAYTVNEPLPVIINDESSSPAMKPSKSFDNTDERKTKALTALQKAKKVSTIKGLIAEQKAFKATPEGKDFQSGVTIEDVVNLNTIEVVGDFYKFVK